MSTETKPFSDWLRQQIKLREMTQADFAEAGHITASQVSHVINGKRNPETKFFEATARAFNMPVVEIYRVAGVIPAGGDSAKFPYTDKEMRLIYLFRELDAGQQGHLLEYAEFLRSRGK